jgi:general secretion pathway protein N
MTRLLAALCAWALLLVAMVVAGLGNRFPEPAQLAAAAPPVPALKAMKSRLGPPADYLEVGARPLLMPDRRPGIVTANGGQAGAGDLDVSLTSVLMTPTLQMVILTGNQDGRSLRVRLGDTAEGSNWRLIRLEPRRATFERPTGEVTLELRVFDGKGAGDAAASSASPPKPDTPEPAVANAPVNAAPVPAPANAPAAPTTQEQQIEAIRRRIEARRAQMRAAAGANDNEDNH